MNSSKVARLWKALKVIMPALLIAVIMFQIVNVNAQDNAQFGVRPTNQNSANTAKGYFTFSAAPGASIQESITLSNPGTAPIKLMVAPVDAITSQRSGPGYLGLDDQRKEVGTWIQFETNELTVSPQKQVDVKFTVKVPANVKNGQHLGGIVVQPVAATPDANATTSTGSSFGATTVTRNVIAVMVTVGTEKFNPSIKIEGVQIKDVEGSPTITISLNNDGPILAQPKGDLTITDASGKVVLNNKLSLESLVPQTSIDYPIFSELTKTPGTYNVKASLDFGGAAPAVYTGVFTIANSKAVATTAPVVEQPALIPGIGKGNSQPTSSNPAATVVATSKTESESQSLIPIIGGVLLLLVVVGGGSYFAGKKGKGRA